MKIAPKPKARIEFKEVNCGEVFTVDGSTLTYMKTPPMRDSESESNVNAVSLATGSGHWWADCQKVMTWPDATVTF
ncbi:hypothetical protein [Salmonella phage 7-11]|uniref:Uncharacterized protein n=1 Tax=Salmonella phage 7-11 TaxID=1054968 RepID=G0X545_9CAUD|nr:hypothetical protein SaPh711_gp112 [Salmonella phage 7-11]AEK82027.1 hypothetical protein [Salmonella phage 7-11]